MVSPSCPTRVPQDNNTVNTVSRYNYPIFQRRNKQLATLLMSACYVEHSPPEITDTSIPLPPPEPPGLTKHADLWFFDGSVILQAESTLFRVHKSQLSRRSIVFSDMFALA